jgi:hypothetical protein
MAVFVTGEFDGLCSISQSSIGDPMRQACSYLSLANQPAGHWLPLERKAELAEDIRSWVNAKQL